MSTAKPKRQRNHNGQRLKMLREFAGVTQSELGMRFGIDRSVLSLIESGYRDMPEDKRDRIEKYLTQLAHKRLETITGREK